MNPKLFPYMRFLPVLILAFLAFKFINQTEVLINGLTFVMSIFVPLFWAFIIAYLLNPMMQFFERVFKAKRGMAVLLVYLVVILTLASIVSYVIPRIARSTAEIISEFDTYAAIVSEWVTNRVDDINALESLANTYGVSLESLTDFNLEETLVTMLNNLQNFALTLGQTAFDITSGVFKFIMGLVISVYLLKDKEAFNYHSKRMMKAYLGEKTCDFIVQLGREIDEVFSKYFIGKTIDSIIIGILCFIGLMVLKVKYPMLLAIIVGITNMVPYFGPFIGAVPAILLTLFISPIQAVWVALFILALQQLDGYVIGPKILGGSVGMSPFWIIIAILVGGGFFGVLGMLIGVPVLAVVRNLNEKYVSKKLNET